MGMGTGIFSNCGYGDEDYSTLPIPYPLPSLRREGGDVWLEEEEYIEE
jgi:hypothetical protein